MKVRNSKLAILALLALCLISCSENPDRVLLNQAIGNSDGKTIAALAARGVDLSNQDRTGPRNTPLIWAIIEDDKEIIGLLLKCGANPDIKNRDGRTPLIEAVMGGDENAAIVDMLIKAGADVNIMDKHGCNALSYARADPVASKIIKLLKNAGAK